MAVEQVCSAGCDSHPRVTHTCTVHGAHTVQVFLGREVVCDKRVSVELTVGLVWVLAVKR